jgi:hypothetical protein
MTVEELIEELQNFEPDTPVHFSYNYGDYWKTVVAPETRTVEELPIVYSDYHSMPKLAEDSEDTRETSDKVNFVVVIS